MNNLGDRGPGEAVFTRGRVNQADGVFGFDDFANTKPDASFTNDQQAINEKIRKEALEALRKKLEEENSKPNSPFKEGISGKKVDSKTVPQGTQETLGKGPLPRDFEVVKDAAIDRYNRSVETEFSTIKPSNAEVKLTQEQSVAIDKAMESLRKNSAVKKVLRPKPVVEKVRVEKPPLAEVSVQETPVPIQTQEAKAVVKEAAKEVIVKRPAQPTEYGFQAKLRDPRLTLEEKRAILLAEKERLKGLAPVAKAVSEYVGEQPKEVTHASLQVVQDTTKKPEIQNIKVAEGLTVADSVKMDQFVTKNDTSAASPLFKEVLSRHTEDLASSIADFAEKEERRKAEEARDQAAYNAFRQNVLQEKEKQENKQEKKKSLLERLSKRSKEAGEKLSKFGLEHLDAYKALSTKQKLLVGVTFIGLSVATGGATSIVSKLLSTASFSRGFYESLLKAEIENGNTDIKKRLLAARATLYGAVAAFGGAEVIENIFEAIPESVTETIKDKTSFITNGLKDIFGIKHDVVSPVVEGKVTATPIPPLDTTEMPATVLEVTSVSEKAAPDVNVATPETSSLIPHALSTEYLVKEGEDLTKIITREVLPYVKGAELLADSQKENVIQNILQHAKVSTDGTLSTLSNLYNQNLIRVGSHLDLEQIRQVLENSKIDIFGDKTFVEHALTLDPASISKNIEESTGAVVGHVTESIHAAEVAQVVPQNVALEEVASTLIGMANVNETIDVYKPYVLKEGDTAESLFKRVLATIEGANTMTEIQKDALVDRYVHEYSSWYNRWTTTGGILKDIKGGVGTEIHSLHRVRDVLIDAVSKIKH